MIAGFSPSPPPWRSPNLSAATPSPSSSIALSCPGRDLMGISVGPMRLRPVRPNRAWRYLGTLRMRDREGEGAHAGEMKYWDGGTRYTALGDGNPLQSIQGLIAQDTRVGEWWPPILRKRQGCTRECQDHTTSGIIAEGRRLHFLLPATPMSLHRVTTMMEGKKAR